jgi:hypothetical protein
MRRFAEVICGHADSKRVCGRVLNAFTRHMQAPEAAGFVFDVVNHDFFLDLRGTMAAFLGQLGEIRETIADLMKERNFMGEDEELIDLDADEHGNLK